MADSSINETPELWKPVVGHEGRYEVSNLGRVRSLDVIVRRRENGRFLQPGRILTPTFSRGYPYVMLCDGDGQKRSAVAVIVCLAFHGARPQGKDVAHGDGDPANARADNLRWATRKENAADKKLHGTEPFGETHPRAKLTEVQAREIKRRLAAGESQHPIARAIGIGRGAVCDIKRGLTWRHI